MSSQRQPPAGWQLLILTIAFLCGIGHSPSASGQGFTENASNPSARPDHADNPQTHLKRSIPKGPVNRAKQTPSNLPQPSPITRVEEKQQAIEQAIADGNEAREKNDYKQALNHYRAAATLNSKEARAFYGMGNVYSDLYCYDSTIEAYLKALAFKIDYLEARVGLGWAFVSKERYDDAAQEFRSVLKPASKNVSANIGLGVVYAKKGKYQEAIEQINIIINDKSIPDKDRATA